MRLNSPGLLLYGRLGASALALISAPIVARAIGPDGRGETAAAVALFSLVPVMLGMGLPLELRRVVASEGNSGSIRASRRLVLASPLFSVPLALILGSTLFQSFEEAARIAATVGVALTPLTLSWICDISVLVATRDFLGIVALQLIQPFVYLIGIILLWLVDWATTASVITVYVVSNAASFLFGLCRVKVPADISETRPVNLMKGSVRYSGGALAESASNRLDQVLALPIIGAAQAGLYSVSVTVGLAPLAVAQALSASSFTSVATAEGRRRQRLVSDSIRQVTSVSLATALVLFFLGPSIVLVLFGSPFADAAPAIRVSAFSCLFASIAVQASSNLVALGRPKQLAISQLVSLVVGIIALLILGPSNGSLGAALASSLGYATLALLAVRGCRASLWSIIPSPLSFVAGVRVLFRSN